MRLKNAFSWMSLFLRTSIVNRPKINKNQPIDIIFCFVDHFEPRVGNVSLAKEIERVEAWVKGYPELADKHIDYDGKPPQHTWFFPLDQFWAAHLDKLMQLVDAGYGEIEVHLHHRDDTSERLAQKLELAKRIFTQHGALAIKNASFGKKTNSIRPKAVFAKYAFIHGNWALDNSRQDANWCGVNNELQILKQTGCYADFTFPSGLSETQPKKVNKIYYATDAPAKPKSYNNGVDVEVGKPPSGDLMLITGPVGLNWKRRKWRIFPTLENSDVSWHHLPTEERVNLWLKTHIHVKGCPNWLFIKLHTHGAVDKSFEMLLDTNGAVHRTFQHLEERYNDGENYRLHYVTAREMYNIIKAAESGMPGNPNAYRNYELIPYNSQSSTVNPFTSVPLTKRW